MDHNQPVLSGYHPDVFGAPGRSTELLAVPDDPLLPLDDPLLPLSDDAATYGATSSYSGTNDPVGALGVALGGLLGAGAGEIAQDPRVQALVAEAAETCRDRAKAGVTEWIYENRVPIAWGAGGTVAVLLLGHFVLSVTALSLAFPRNAFSDFKQR